jgi:hypothetical protein
MKEEPEAGSQKPEEEKTPTHDLFPLLAPGFWLPASTNL